MIIIIYNPHFYPKHGIIPYGAQIYYLYSQKERSV